MLTKILSTCQTRGRSGDRDFFYKINACAAYVFLFLQFLDQRQLLLLVPAIDDKPGIDRGLAPQSKAMKAGIVRYRHWTKVQYTGLLAVLYKQP